MFRRLAPVLDGSAVQIGDGTVRTQHLTIPAEEYPLPFWVRFDGAAGKVRRVDTLPARIVARAGSMAVLSAPPGGTPIPGGVRHWTVDDQTALQTWAGWGVGSQIGQEYVNFQSPTPPHFDEAVARVVDGGLTIGFASMFPGFARSDADYYGAWLAAGVPGSGAIRDAMFAHRHWPIDNGAPQYWWSHMDLKLPFIQAYKAAVEAAGGTFYWYVKIAHYDNPVNYPTGAPPAGHIVLSANPDVYAEIQVSFHNYLQSNYPDIYPPNAIDVVNEMGLDNSWDAATTEALACMVATDTALGNAGHPLPDYIGPSYQNPGLFTAARIDTWWNANGGALRGRIKHGTHMYGHGGNPTEARNNLATINSVVASRGGSYWDTEAVWTPLHLLTQITRGRCSAIINFSCVIGSIGKDDIFRVNRFAPQGSQLSDQANTKANRLLWQALRPGDLCYSTPRVNLVDGDNAEGIWAKNPISGMWKFLSVTANAVPIWTQPPVAGTYRLRKVLCTVSNPFAGQIVTVQATDYDGVLHVVGAGDGVHLNGADNDAAGVFTLVQEA